MHVIKYHPLPLKMQGQQVPSAAGPAAHMLPPPADDGRVVVVAKLLRDMFTVVMECPLRMPMNSMVYGLIVTNLFSSNITIEVHNIISQTACCVMQ